MKKKGQFPIANPSLVLREEFDDWAILFDPDTGHAYGLNPVSVFIFKLLDGRNSSQDILTALREQCDDVPEEVEKDIAGFINQLLEKGYAGFEAT